MLAVSGTLPLIVYYEPESSKNKVNINHRNHENYILSLFLDKLYQTFCTMYHEWRSNTQMAQA